MAPQVTIVFNAPVNVKISEPEASGSKPTPQEPNEVGETLITSGKHRGKRFIDALGDPKYVKWIQEHRHLLAKSNLKLLASFFAKATTP